MGGEDTEEEEEKDREREREIRQEQQVETARQRTHVVILFISSSHHRHFFVFLVFSAPSHPESFAADAPFADCIVCKHAFFSPCYTRLADGEFCHQTPSTPDCSPVVVCNSKRQLSGRFVYTGLSRDSGTVERSRGGVEGKQTPGPDPTSCSSSGANATPPLPPSSSSRSGRQTERRL